MTYTLEKLNRMVENSNGGSLWLDGLTSIPEGFNPTVGGSLGLNGLTSSQRRKVKINRPMAGYYEPGEYIYSDRICPS